MQLRGAWDLNNPRLLRKQPSERDLSRCRLLPFCDPAEQINQGLIRLESLRREAREGVAEVGAVESRVFVHLSREEAPAKRTKWNESDSEFLEGRQHFRFRLSPPQRIFALECCKRLDGVCATNRLHSRLRKAEVLHLAFLNQLFHRAGDIFNRHAGIDAVLIEHVDGIDPEPLARSLESFLDMLRSTIESNLLTFRTKFESELGGNYDSLTDRS